MNQYFLIAALLVGVASAASADEGLQHQHSHEKHPRCPEPKAFRDVIACLSTQHSSVQISEKTVQIASAETSAASQWSNPDLQVQGMKGSDAGSYQIQAALLFEAPFVGARSSRIHAAEASASRAQANQELLRSEIKIDGILKLVRLRQLLRELDINELTSGTLSRALGALRARGRLTPELETTSSIFIFSSHEAAIARSLLLDERRAIGHFFEIHTGLTFAQLEKVLQPEYKSWPSVERSKRYEGTSPSLRALQADVSLSQSALSQQRAWAGSNLRLGPTFEKEKDAFRNETRYGLQLSLPLPLFNFNGAGKSHALAEVTRAETAFALGRTEEEHERLEQAESYEQAVQILSDLPSQDDLNRRLDRGFSQYQRGMVSAPHLMELYRQAIDFLKARHERERLAIRSLWAIHQIDNRSVEENP